MRFIFSAFWGGQEGGFLLWMFWHNVLGLVLCGRIQNGTTLYWPPWQPSNCS